jgi:hypothetical protein
VRARGPHHLDDTEAPGAADTDDADVAAHTDVVPDDLDLAPLDTGPLAEADEGPIHGPCAARGGTRLQPVRMHLTS